MYTKKRSYLQGVVFCANETTDRKTAAVGRKIQKYIRGDFVKVTRMTNKDKGFYSLLGPYLARRSVEKELGYRIYDDDEKTWFIAKETNDVQGFCYLAEKSDGKYQVGSCYVVHEYRKKGIFGKLIDAAVMAAGEGLVFVTTNSKVMQDILVAKGFEPAKQKGSFVEYMKELKTNDV